MKIRDIYELAVRKGIEQDPRGAKLIEKALKKAKHAYDELKPEKKHNFDKESLVNPYADTRLLCGEPDKEVKAAMVGIDIDAGEALLADRLKQAGRQVDLVISHHPIGRAYAGFYEVMHMQADILTQAGVPINIAEALLGERIKEVERRVHSANHTRVVDAARLLGIALMCIHTPADNHVASYLSRLMDKKRPELLDDAVAVLNDIPEYKEASCRNAGPKIALGTGKNRAGRIMVDMTGGTEGSKEIFKELSKAGISTIICMHLSEEHIGKAQQEHINVIIAGHIASDTLGLNLLLDDVVKKGRLEIVSCSGFVRIKR